MQRMLRPKGQADRAGTSVPVLYNKAREQVRQPLCPQVNRKPVCQGMGRKVRAPQGKVPGNAWEARAYGKCHRKQTAQAPKGAGKGETVR